MPRKRMIDPELWIDEKVAQMSLGARLLFIGSWNFADDNGNFHYSAARLRAQIFPHDTDITNDTVEGYIKEILELGPYAEYQLDGHRYINIVHFLDYQRINRPSPTKIPKPVDISPTTQRLLSEDSVRAHGVLTAEGKLSKVEGKVGGREEPPPTFAPLSEKEKEFFAVYENYLGTVPSILVPDLKLAANTYSLDWVEDAFVTMSDANIEKPCWKYVHTILEKWRIKGRGAKGRGAKGKQDDLSDSPEEYGRRYEHLLKRQGDDATE